MQIGREIGMLNENCAVILEFLVFNVSTTIYSSNWVLCFQPSDAIARFESATMSERSFWLFLYKFYKTIVT